jgi:hypothetical protein
MNNTLSQVPINNIIIIVVLAYGGAHAVSACVPLSAVITEGDAPAVSACAPPSAVITEGGVPEVFCMCSSVGRAGISLSASSSWPSSPSSVSQAPPVPVVINYDEVGKRFFSDFLRFGWGRGFCARGPYFHTHSPPRLQLPPRPGTLGTCSPLSPPLPLLSPSPQVHCPKALMDHPYPAPTTEELFD